MASSGLEFFPEGASNGEPAFAREAEKIRVSLVKRTSDVRDILATIAGPLLESGAKQDGYAVVIVQVDDSKVEVFALANFTTATGANRTVRVSG